MYIVHNSNKAQCNKCNVIINNNNGNSHFTTARKVIVFNISYVIVKAWITGLYSLLTHEGQSPRFDFEHSKPGMPELS